MSASALGVTDRPSQPSGLRHSARAAGLVATVLGTGLLISSFTWAAWLRFPLEIPPRARFNAEITLAGLANPHVRGGPRPALMSAYLSWLGWALLAAAIVVALLALGPLRSALAIRVGALLTPLCGLAVTVAAVRQLQVTMHTRWRTFLHVTWTGVWFAVAGFALICVAALVTLRSSDAAKPAVE